MFRMILHELLATTAGAQAALFLDWEGETVELAPRAVEIHHLELLDTPDPECEIVDLIRGEGRTLDIEYAMKNNFAFGGINTSLVFRRI